MGERSRQQRGRRIVGDIDHLNFGRAAYEERAWDDAYRQLARADETDPLAVDDLERLAMSAYLTARDEDYLRALDRVHHAFLHAGNNVRAARAAFWLGLRLAFRGESGRATGWFGRAERLLQRESKTHVEEGYLLLPAAEQKLRSGELEAAAATATHAAEIGDRFGDADLSTCARHVQGRALIRQGALEKGLALLDEAMVAVAAGELSPIMTGLIYCSVIDACQEVYALDRAHEWTDALAAWCAEQPQLIAFTGTCLVHRAEIMQMSGKWRDALEEAERACATFSTGLQEQTAAAAFYQQGEVYRLRGEFRAAEDAYRRASRQGCEPQPGLALLRLAKGQKKTAATAIRRALSTTADRLRRVRLLPAYVEILVAAGDLEEASSACRELEETADRFATVALRGLADQASGAVALAAEDARSALESLRRAFEAWQRIAAPYLAARARELIGLGCRALGDEEAAQLELIAAREDYDRLGAAPDAARAGAHIRTAEPAPACGLTRRELQVLRLVAAGATNKAVAVELSLSERTIDRHVSNIFGKLDVSSRTAAAAWAHQHKLV